MALDPETTLHLWEAKHWLEASIAVCQLLMLEDQSTATNTAVYHETLQQARAALDRIEHQGTSTGAVVYHHILQWTRNALDDLEESLRAGGELPEDEPT